MYKTMGVYGLLNNQWALILAMVTIASPYSIWVLKQASDKLPYELDEAAKMDGASPLQLFRLVYLPLMTPSLVAIGTYALLLAWNEYLYAFLLLSKRHADHARRGARQLPRGRRFAVGAADDDGPDLRAAAGGDLLRVQALHGRRPDGRRGQELNLARRLGASMASVSFQNIEKSFGSTKVIHGISFDIKDGEFMVLVGPSGCGKSTLLRMLAGLEEITGGTIAIDGKVVNDVESKDRDIAMVFQSYALYPHMTVGENMAFSLKLRKADPKMMAERVAHASKILNLDPYLERYPRELSGGQRQRVAMGRAIVRDPKVFLFDEPLSNLDAKLRVAMRAEIKALHQRLKTTTVYVTHDQVEAMTMADRIVVMHDGRIEQIGTPLELYDHPDNLFVAQFIGSPAMNVVERHGAGAAAARAHVEAAGGVRWPLAGRSGRGRPGRRLRHPAGDLRLAGADGGGAVPAEIIVVEPTGAETELLIQAGEAS